ncbi:MAG: hypothetical protein IKP92_00580 [Lachnospiraceae bacterium]|nr:hypothetical protein [Lachnospiraceae bacterium]
MPGFNYNEYSEKRKNLTVEELDALTQFRELLETVDADPKSYLSEELTPYARAIGAIINKLDRKTVEKSFEDLKGMEAFLLSGENALNYTLLRSDSSFGKGSVATMENTEIIEKGLKVIAKLGGFEIDVKKISDEAEKKGFRPDKMRRVLNTKSVETYNDYLKIKNQGKTFIEPGSNANKSLQKFEVKLTTAMNNVKDSNAELYENTKQFLEAVQTLKSADPKKEEVEAALKTVRAFPDYLKRGVDGSNYQRLLDAGLTKVAFENGMGALDLALCYKIDIQGIEKSKGHYKTKEDTADNWIKAWRNELKQKPNSFNVGDPETKMFLARFYATRMLVNSVRHKGDAFSKRLTNAEIDKKAQELLENKTFSDFMDKVVSDKKNLAEAGKAIANGHAGALDDAFKHYILHAPSGKLPNDPLLARYMPRVIDRIEVLQDRAKSMLHPVVGKGTLPAKEIAEVYALRGMIRAQRDHKEALKVNIPTEKSISKLTEKNLKDNFFNKKFTTDELDVFCEGHGGKFAQEQLMKHGKNKTISDGGPLWLSMNAGRDADLINQDDYELTTFADKLKLNTRQGMLAVTDLKEAMAKDPESDETKALCDKCYDLVIEAIALVELYKLAQETGLEKPRVFDPAQLERFKNSLNTEYARNELFGNEPDPQKYVDTMHSIVRDEHPERAVNNIMKAHEDRISYNPDKFYQHLAEKREIKISEPGQPKVEGQKENETKVEGGKGPTMGSFGH